MKFKTSRNPVFRNALAATLIGAALSASLCGAANAQSIPMQCADPVAQDPTKIFRSGLWK